MIKMYRCTIQMSQIQRHYNQIMAKKRRCKNKLKSVDRQEGLHCVEVKKGPAECCKLPEKK